MARLTGLERDARHPDGVRVLVDGRLFCTLNEAALGELGLRVGVEWTADLAARASRAADEEAAWRAAVAALARRGHAVEELRRRLVRNGHRPEAAERAIQRALQRRLLDDAAFALAYVGSRAPRGRGPDRLRRDLASLGVARNYIERAVQSQWPEPEDALSLARELVLKRARQLRDLPREVRRRRLVAYLGRRGFSGRPVRELISRALREP